MQCKEYKQKQLREKQKTSAKEKKNHLYAAFVCFV